MFNNPYSYNNFNNPYVTQYHNNNIRSEIARVNGENGANAYNLAPNSSILLLDETQPIVYLKTTDSGGYPTIKAYSIMPYQKEEPINVKSLEQRIERLEVLFNEQSNTKSNEPKQYQSSNVVNVQDNTKRK